MNTLLAIALYAIAALAAIALLVRWAHGFRRAGLISALNTKPASVGSTRGSRRYKATAALATRYLWVKQGADDEHIAAITATADKPIGVISDEAEAAEDAIDVELPGNGRTLPCVAGAALATLNLDVYTSAAGKVVGKPTTAGTYWKVGRNLTLADADTDPVEVQTCEPEKLTIIAALTSTNGTAAAAIPGALTSTNATAGAAIPGALTSTNGTAAAAIPGALTVGADIGVFTDPPSAAQMALLRTFVNALKTDQAAIHAAALLLAAEAEKIGDDARAIHAADLLAQAEAEKIGDDARAIHAAALLLAAEAEKIGDDTRAIATGLAAAGGGVALATT